MTKQVPADVASDADGVEALPRPRAGLLHRLHWRHEYNVKSCGVLATKSEVIFELLDQHRSLCLIHQDHLRLQSCLSNPHQMGVMGSEGVEPEDRLRSRGSRSA